MDATEQTLDLLVSLLQSAMQPVADGSGQKAIRALTQSALRVPVEDGIDFDLASGPLTFTTSVSAAWDAHVIGVSFDTSAPRTLRISLLLDNVEFPLVSEPGFNGSSAIVSDHVSLNAGDQVRVYVSGGTGLCHVAVRGEMR